jgi:hypothetical protein
MTGSGADPIDDAPTAADLARVTTTAIRYQQDHHKAGRFGREVRAMPDDGRKAERSTKTGTGEPHVLAARYEVDPHAVAGAIIARLAAGGTLRLPPEDAPRGPAS